MSAEVDVIINPHRSPLLLFVNQKTPLARMQMLHPRFKGATEKHHKNMDIELHKGTVLPCNSQVASCI